MSNYWFEDLKIITPEEQLILDGKNSVQKNLYTDQKDFVIESNKFMPAPTEDIVVRRHTRFIYFPLHRHDYVEVFHVLAGSVTHVINGEEITVHTGELLFLNQNVKHSIHACGENDLAMNVMIRPVYFRSILNAIDSDNILADFMANALENDNTIGQYLYFSISNNRCIQNLLQNAFDLLINKPQNWHHLSENTFALLFSHILSNAENLLLDQSNEKANVLMLVIHHYIMDYYDVGTLNELADHMGYTPASLSRMIKKYSGSTFKEMQTKQRMLIAMEKIRNTDLPIAEIASSVGYENLTFFYKQFNKKYGMTPNEFRKNCGKENSP